MKFVLKILLVWVIASFLGTFMAAATGVPLAGFVELITTGYVLANWAFTTSFNVEKGNK